MSQVDIGEPVRLIDAGMKDQPEDLAVLPTREQRFCRGAGLMQESAHYTVPDDTSNPAPADMFGAPQACEGQPHAPMSIVNDSPFQLCYVSHVVEGTSDRTVSDIAVLATERNLAARISGALLFDGRRFCQLLEGHEGDVRQLMARIEGDSRHRVVSVNAAGHYGLPRLTTHWVSGVCDPLAMEPLVSTPVPRGEVALALFMSILAAASMAQE